MTTVAYCAVSNDGRTFSDQLTMNARSLPHFRALTRGVHDAGGRVSLQLAHAGGFTKNLALRGRRGPLGPSFGLNAYGLLSGLPFVYAMKEREMEKAADDFAAAAVLARDAGFDAVELHLGHGYLLSQFLSPLSNRRRDGFGGSLERRLRFPLSVVRALRNALGPSFPILAKTNLSDGVKGGLGIEEACVVAQALESERVTALVLSGGLVTQSAMFLLRGGRPLRKMIGVEKSLPQKLALALFGPLLVKRVPFEPLFFFDLACEVRRCVQMPLALLGGVSTASDVERGLDAGFELFAMARALLHDPTLVSRLRRGEVPRSHCSHCNECMVEMDRPGGVVCVEQPDQLARREAEVRRHDHLTPAGDARP